SSLRAQRPHSPSTGLGDLPPNARRWRLRNASSTERRRMTATRESILERLLDALAGREVRVIDLSHPLSAATPMIHLPEPLVDAPGWTLRPISRYDDAGPMYYWNSFEGSEHMGTHFDAPVHWFTGRDGLDVSQIAPIQLIGRAFVLDRRAEAEANA